MKQIQFDQHGPASVLAIKEVATPEPQAGEILIQTEAVGINFMDIMQRKGTYPMSGKLPFVLGSEVVGRVAKVGAGVSFKEGDRVGVLLSNFGAYSEFVVAPAASAIPIPEGVDPAAVTALMIQGLTAYGLLHNAAKIKPGDRVLIHAGAGGVGSLAIQLAYAADAVIFSTASTEAKRMFITELGAHASLDYVNDDWVQQIYDLSGNHGVDVVLEMVGGQIGQDSLRALASGGQMIVFGTASGQPAMIPSNALIGNSLRIKGYTLYEDMPEIVQDGLPKLLDMLASRELKVKTSAYAFEDVVKAHEDIENRRTTGKVALVF